MIESLKNRHIKDIRRLRRSKGERAVLEGPHLVEEALAAGIAIESVLATPDYLASAPQALTRQFGSKLQTVAPRILERITDADSPRGILAVALLPRPTCEDLPRPSAAIYVFVVGLQDPGNLGAVSRAAEAVGVTALALAPEGVHPNHPRALRASAGSLLRLPVAIGVTPERLTEHLRPLDPTWVALAPQGETDVYEAAPVPPLVLVVGSERGLAPEIERICHTRLRIPMAQPVESLNTAVATALALFEIKRRAETRS